MEKKQKLYTVDCDVNKEGIATFNKHKFPEFQFNFCVNSFYAFSLSNPPKPFVLNGQDIGKLIHEKNCNDYCIVFNVSDDQEEHTFFNYFVDLNSNRLNEDRTKYKNEPKPNEIQSTYSVQLFSYLYSKFPNAVFNFYKAIDLSGNNRIFIQCNDNGTISSLNFADDGPSIFPPALTEFFNKRYDNI